MQQIKGAITALVTPMRDGRIDEQGLVDLIEFQIAGGIHGLVPCGATGEAGLVSEVFLFLGTGLAAMINWVSLTN